MKMNIEYGMNIHNSAYAAYPAADLEENIKLCKELGLKTIRFNQACNDLEAIEEVKRVSDVCRKNGMKLVLVVDVEKHYGMQSLGEIEREMAEHYKFISSSLRDAVDIYQIYNEMDVHCMGGNIANIFLAPADGKEKGEYDSALFERCVAAVKGALKGIKDGFPGSKTCINFAWWHTALIYELYERGCRWDVVGIDWYSDCEEVSSVELLIDDVTRHIPDCDIMICETNFWMNLHERYTPERKEALKEAENRDRQQAEWIPGFIDTLLRINNPRLKSVVFYELLDEPVFEKSGGYNGESHFGFIACRKNGKGKKQKPAFYALQKKLADIKQV